MSDDLVHRFDDQLERRPEDPFGALLGLLRTDRVAGLLQLQGEVVAGYRLDRVLGVGGMGVTYDGRSSTGDSVAVKVVDVSGERIDRFQRECKVLRQLEHEGVVRYRSHGRIGDRGGFIIMDRVGGSDLQSVLEDMESADPVLTSSRTLFGSDNDVVGRARRFAALLLGVAEGMHHAHGRGVVHRDLKPANVMVGDDLRPVVIDFGLSRDLFDHADLTQSCAVVGTMAYMAPERMTDARGDHRGDIYSLGLILFRCVAGRELRVTLDEVMGLPRSEVWRRLSVLPPPLYGIAARCLALNPDRRYATMLEVAKDLKTYLTGGPVRSGPGLIHRALLTRRGAIATSLGALIGLVVVLRSRAYRVTVDDINDNGRVVVDGGDSMLPNIPIDLDPGWHEFKYAGPDLLATVHRRFLVTREVTRVNVISVSGNRLNGPEITHEQYTGEDWALLKVSAPRAVRVTASGQPWPEGARWVRVRAGKHDVRAEGAGGEREEQSIVVPSAEARDVWLLGDELADVRSSFRITLGNVMSAWPTCANLQLEGDAVIFMNANPDMQMTGQPGFMPRKTCVSTERPGYWGTATLRITFPEPMKTIRFAFRAFARDGELVIKYRSEDGGWIGYRTVEGTDARHRETLEVAEGARWFEIQARMRCDVTPPDYRPVEFLFGTFDPPPDTPGEIDETPCFEVVAQ